MADRNVINSLLRFDSCTVSDAMDRLGLAGAVSGLAPLTIVGSRVAGRAVTVKLGDAIDGGTKSHLGARAVMVAESGDVIVIEHRGRTDVSGWGGLLSRGAVDKGVAAVIVDGACRDVDESRDLGLPVFARNAVPVTARGRISEHDFNCPVMMAGVTVNPGDWLVADGSGVVFIPASRLDDVIAIAQDILARETLMARDIAAGIPIGEVMGANYEDMLKGPDVSND